MILTRIRMRPLVAAFAVIPYIRMLVIVNFTTTRAYCALVNVMM